MEKLQKNVGYILMLYLLCGWSNELIDPLLLLSKLKWKQEIAQLKLGNKPIKA